MSINIARFYRREKLELDCEVITPMFLGNANQEAELRSAPFKGLLRYWWRIAEGAKHSTPEKLLDEENKIFGSPDEEHGGKSQVTVAVRADLQCYQKSKFPESSRRIVHQEVKNKQGNPVSIDRYLYLGYGPITGAGVLKSEGKGAFCPGQSFALIITGNQKVIENLQVTFNCLQQFGAIGGRSRNGWGCFAVESNGLPLSTDTALFQKIGAPWQNSFSRDYPHQLGLDGRRLLFWKCRNSHSDWQETMGELAEIYMNTRLEHKFPNERGPHSNPQDRHVLGYPCGKNHGVRDWGNASRHGSALRLLVRREDGGFRGYILHLPHLFSTEMWPDSRQRQLEIWNQVHRSLDTLCERVTMEVGQ